MPWEKESPKVKSPPCQTCEVKLLPENRLAFAVYQRCADDWVVMGGMEPVRTTISGPAIETALNITGVKGEKLRSKIYDKVKNIGRAIAKELMAERAKQNQEQA